MRAMVLPAAGQRLELTSRPVPTPAQHQVLIEVEACGVCRTDLHLRDGDLPMARYPIVPGHQIVGRVVASCCAAVAEGTRVGVPWLGRTCGVCGFCHRGEENLCDDARFTGCQIDGGYAEYALADGRFCLPLPEEFEATGGADIAPLLCAGLIGYRSLRMCGNQVRHLGLYGFGAAAHLLTQIAVRQDIQVHAFTRPGDQAGQRFARSLGCVWAGGSDQRPDTDLDAAIIFAPVGALVPRALRAVRKGGRVVCGGIHMSDIPSFPYADLWGERQIRSVANLTRQDGTDFLKVAAEAGARAKVQQYPLEKANMALDDLASGKVEGAAVLRTRS